MGGNYSDEDVARFKRNDRNRIVPRGAISHLRVWEAFPSMKDVPRHIVWDPDSGVMFVRRHAWRSLRVTARRAPERRASRRASTSRRASSNRRASSRDDGGGSEPPDPPALLHGVERVAVSSGGAS